MLRSAQVFLDALELAKIKHKEHRVLDDGKELITCGFEAKNSRFDVFFVFDADSETVCIRVPRLVSGCPEDKTLRMLDAINEINTRYRWLKLYLDQNQNVDVQIDAYVNDSAENNVCVKLLLRMLRIIEESYPSLMRAIWA